MVLRPYFFLLVCVTALPAVAADKSHSKKKAACGKAFVLKEPGDYLERFKEIAAGKGAVGASQMIACNFIAGHKDSDIVGHLSRHSALDGVFAEHFKAIDWQTAKEQPGQKTQVVMFEVETKSGERETLAFRKSDTGWEWESFSSDDDALLGAIGKAGHAK